MLSFKKLNKILEELDNYDLFNLFFMNLFDYRKEELKKLVIRYFFDEGFIIDIFDYNETNFFIRYYFYNNNNINDNNSIIFNDIVVKNINLNKLYNNFDNSNKFSLFSSLFYEKDKDKIKENLNNLFDKDIVSVFLKYIN